MAKRTKRRSTSKKTPKKRSLSRRFVFLLVFCIALLGLGLGTYLLVKQNTASRTKETLVNEELMNKMKVMLENERKRLSEKKLPTISEIELPPVKKEVLPPEPSVYAAPKEEKVTAEIATELPKKKVETSEKSTEALDYEKSVKVTKKKMAPVQKKVIHSGRPKLAIIIDDVSFAHQVRAIKAIPFKVTPSFLPPTKRHADSHTLVDGFSFYMVHLPLEALSHNAPELITLKVGLDYKGMKEHIVRIKKQFPHAIYYNNHTGSRFTANKRAMDLLFRIMKEEGLIFVDSRTTADTKAGEMAIKYGVDLFSRDVFLDNSYDEASIVKQLKLAVDIAKKTGSAIAIGHPHKSTLTVLAQSKSLLKDVDVVYLKEL